MAEAVGWWRGYFHAISGARSKCARCGEEMDVRAGRPQKHLALAHGIQHEAPVEEDGLEQAEAKVEEGLEGLSREERLRNLLHLANDTTAAQRDRVAAETLIAKYQGYLDSPPEEDEDESREKALQRTRVAVERKAGLAEEVQKWTRDREAKAWLLRQLVGSEDDREWLQKVLREMDLSKS